MKLPFFKKTQKQEKEYLLSLLVRTTSLAAILFEEENKNLAIITSAEEEFPQGMDFASADEITALSDKVISTVEGSLPENEEVSKTIFAVPADWVEDGKIKRDYLLKLKKVCDTLALVPIGFIISVEAIISYLQEKQGAPLTSLFIELFGTGVNVYLVKNGNIVAKKSGEIEGTVAKSVERVLGEFDVEVFPAKIVVFDHTGVHKTVHELVAHKWSEDLPFLHIPKTEALEKDFENEAIVHGVATQMGFDVLEKSQLEEVEHVEETLPGVDFGFVQDQDISEIAKNAEAAKAAEMIPHMKQEHENLVPVETEPEEHHEQNGRQTAAADEAFIDEDEEEKTEKKQGTGFFSFFHMIRLPSLSFPSFPFFKGPGILFIAVIVVLLLIGGVYFYYADIERAEIDITTSTKSVQKDIDVSLQQKTSTSLSQNIIALQTVSIDTDGQDSVSASGKTDTGDKAKGSVTIYNKTDSPKTFSKGTAITGPNNLKFDLTDDVTVASTSAFDTSISSSNVNIVAENFGQEYNIPSGSNFTINGTSSSDYFAKNSSAFSGGTKKTVTAISQSDEDSLLSKVQDDMKSKALQQAQSQEGNDISILPDPLSVSLTQKKFDHKVGDQVATLNLSASATFTFGVYKKSDVASLISSATTGDVPSGFHLAQDKSSFDVKNSTVDKNGNVKATLSAQAVYEPQIDTSTITQQYKGKSADSVERALSSNDGVSDIAVVLKNSLPFMPKLLPFTATHITVVTKSQ